MKILFAGTPDFSVPTLKALLKSHHKVEAILTQPDRPKGRGRKLLFGPIKTVGTEANIPIFQPKRLDATAIAELKACVEIDTVIVIAYGLILPQDFLEWPRFGCINVHASLLPRWRGAAPIHRAVLAGDDETGITIMQMDSGLDTGDMLLKRTIPITKDDTSEILHDQLAQLGATALLECITLIENGNAVAQTQDDALATYAHKLKKEEGKINWSLSAIEIHRQIRGLTPWPGCFSELHHPEQSINLKILSAELAPEFASTKSKPGTIIGATSLAKNTKALSIQTGAGILHLTHLQLPGAKALSVTDILNSKSALFEKGNWFE